MIKAESFDFNKLQPVDRKAQDELSVDICSLLAMDALAENGVKLSFENIVVACFRLFPAKYSLQNYPEFPDSYAVHNSLNLHMQYAKGSSRHWVQGNKRQGYVITPQGRIAMERYLWVLGKKGNGREIRRQGEGEKRFLELILSSDAYKKFIEGRKDEISEEEVCFMLRFPVGADPRLASQQLAKAQKVAADSEKKNLVRLLKEVAESHSNLFAWKGGTWSRRSS